VLDKLAFTAFEAVISSINIVCHREGTLMLPDLLLSSSCNLLYPMKHDQDLMINLLQMISPPVTKLSHA
jgi:hypothetical protein